MRKPNQDERVAKTHDTNRKPVWPAPTKSTEL